MINDMFVLLGLLALGITIAALVFAILGFLWERRVLRRDAVQLELSDRVNAARAARGNEPL